MTINIPENASTEEKLLQLTDALETIRTVIEEIIDDMDFHDQETGSLEEAVDFIENAVDAIGDTVDNLEEEELELDEQDDELEGSNGLHIGIVLGKG